VVTNGTVLAVAVTLGKTLAAVDGAAEVTPLVIGAHIAATDSCFGASAAETAAGCTVEAAEAEVRLRSVCSTMFCCVS